MLCILGLWYRVCLRLKRLLGGVIIPLKPIRELEGKRIKLRIVEVEGIDAKKLYSYIRLLREGEDAEELFEI